MTPEQEFAAWVESSNLDRREAAMKYPSETIPSTTDLPADNYDVEVVDVVEGQSKEGRKLMYTVTMRVRAPKIYEGSSLLDWIVVGTNESPLADTEHRDPKQRNLAVQAWHRNGPRLMQLFNAAGIVSTGDTEADCRAIIRKRLGVSTILAERTINTVDGNGNVIRKGNGELRSRVARNGYFVLGEREIGTAAAAIGEQPQPRRKAALANGEDEPEPEEAAVEYEEEASEPPRRVVPRSSVRTPAPARAKSPRFQDED